MSILSRPYFHDEAAAYAMLESLLWPSGPVCPHCGALDKLYRIKPNPKKRVRIGLHKCGHCLGQFTVKVGTVFEQAHIPLYKCLQAVYLLASSKKGISSNQLARTLEITVKSAWFLSHRIREAMRQGQLVPFGSGGGAVEVDETFIGREPGMPMRSAYHHKMKVITLVDRDSGQARSIVVDDLKVSTLAPLVRETLAKEARLMTDENHAYALVGREFASHGIVHHKHKEYVSRENPDIHTNTIEGFFSIFKRGMKGVYQHCAKQHLHRYLAEFDFRYSNRVALGIDDPTRSIKALAGIRGKRLMYRD